MNFDRVTLESLLGGLAIGGLYGAPYAGIILSFVYDQFYKWRENAKVSNRRNSEYD